MTGKIISVILALVLCFSLVLPASAETGDVQFVIDELGYLTGEELAGLNEQAASVYGQTGVAIFYAYVQTDSIVDYDLDPIVKGIDDYVVMMENETLWCLHTGGRGGIIDVAAEDALRQLYDETPTYVEGVRVYLEAAAEYFPEAAAPATEIVWDADERFLYDEADLLTEEEETALTEKLETLSHRYQAQLVVVTIPELAGGDVDSYNDYLYDSMGFGYGEDKDGVLLLVCMDPREYRILSNGYAGVAIGPDQIDTLCGYMDVNLPGGYYNTAFHAFADVCGEQLDYYLQGSPFNAGRSLAISLVIGLVVGLITVFVLKGQLKTVRQQYQAHSYIKRDSMQVTLRQDIFLYREVSRTRREEDSDSDSGGTARSEGGGSF